jgi:hypothetical protein
MKNNDILDRNENQGVQSKCILALDCQLLPQSSETNLRAIQI